MTLPLMCPAAGVQVSPQMSGCWARRFGAGPDETKHCGKPEFTDFGLCEGHLAEVKGRCS